MSDEILQRLENIEKSLNEMKAVQDSINRRYSWEEKQTDNGIEIVGSGVVRYGYIRNVALIPTAQGISPMVVMSDESGHKISIVDVALLRPA